MNVVVVGKYGECEPVVAHSICVGMGAYVSHVTGPLWFIICGERGDFSFCY